MIIFEKISGMKDYIGKIKGEKSIGFVPTMGFLHKGHISLVEISRKISDFTIVSIFVNPLQFLPNEDYKIYPRDIERDKNILIKAGCDALFLPQGSEIYKEGFDTIVSVRRFSKILCGKSRPGHFDGVATIVLKLFNIIKPDIAVFGEKDFQQLTIIKKMVNDLDLDIQIISGPIVREEDGLAMSSRNVYLSKEERKQAICLYEGIKLAKDILKNGNTNSKYIINEVRKFISKFDKADIDYIKIVAPETLEEIKEIKDKARILLAVKIGKTRLIDNDELSL